MRGLTRLFSTKLPKLFLWPYFSARTHEATLCWSCHCWPGSLFPLLAPHEAAAVLTCTMSTSINALMLGDACLDMHTQKKSLPTKELVVGQSLCTRWSLSQLL